MTPLQKARHARWMGLQSKYRIFCMIFVGDKVGIRAINLVRTIAEFKTSGDAARRLVLGSEILIEDRKA